MRAIITIDGAHKKSMELPVSIGSDISCNVFIPKLRAENQFAWQLTIENNRLTLKNQTTNEELNLNECKKYGVTFDMETVLSTEEVSKTEVIPSIQKQSKTRFTPKVLSLALGILSIGTYGIFNFLNKTESTPDFSEAVHDFESASEAKKVFGNVNGAENNAKKVLFELKLKPSSEPQNTINTPTNSGLFTFTDWGIDSAGEYKLFWNNELLYTAVEHAECAKKGCKIKLRVPEHLMGNVKVQIEFRHENPKSSWAIGKIGFLDLQLPSENDKLQAELYLRNAEQDFANKELALVNLVRSHQKAKILSDFSGKFHTTSDKFLQIEHLFLKTTTEVNRVIEEYMFAANKELSRNDIQSTLHKLEELAKLFPERNEGQGRKIQLAMDNLKRRTEK